MYSWDRKFGDVVNDTEKHLTKARQALDSANYRNGLSSYSEDSSSYHRSYPLDSYQPPKQFSPRHSRDVSYPYSRQNDHASGMVAILSEKIERQGKSIEDLTRQVLTLERDNEKGALRLRGLEQEVTSLRQRMSEDGVHLQTEEKVDRFHREVKGKLEELKYQMEIQRRSDAEPTLSAGRDWKEAITAEVHELKRQVERECDSLYREIEIVRAKLIRYDVDLSSQHGDTKEVARRVDKLKEEFHNNASKVSVQLNSISTATRATSHHRYRPLDEADASVPREPLSTSSHQRGQNHRRRKKKAADRYSSAGSSVISSQPLSTSALLSSSTDILSSDSDVRKPSVITEKQDTPPSKEYAKDTDNSLTLSDLEGSEYAFRALSIDSDSLDLDL